jgi:hypothetical protein
MHKISDVAIHLICAALVLLVIAGYVAQTYRGSWAITIRTANLRLRLSFLAIYIQTMVKFCLNYY